MKIRLRKNYRHTFHKIYCHRLCHAHQGCFENCSCDLRTSFLLRVTVLNYVTVVPFLLPATLNGETVRGVMFHVFYFLSKQTKITCIKISIG